MKTSKIELRIIFHIICAILVAFFTCASSLHVEARTVQYEIIFRCGSHGSFASNEGNITYKVGYQEAFPDVPDVVAEEGYVFKGWSPELPEVGSQVTGKEVYVAKYAVLVSGREYMVRYVDANGIDLVTQKVSITENGSTVTERAKTIEGYQVDETQKSATVTEDGTIITFVYKATAQPTAPVQPTKPNQTPPSDGGNQSHGNENNQNEGSNNQENPGNNENQVSNNNQYNGNTNISNDNNGDTGDANNAGHNQESNNPNSNNSDAGNSNKNESDSVEESTVELVTIPTEEVPLADKPGNEWKSDSWMYGVGGGTILLVTVVLIWFFIRKKIQGKL